MKKGFNTIITAHNGLIDNVVLSVKGPKLWLEEGGFFVISNENGKLELKHEFNNFLDFSRVFFPRDFN